jgi:hypothetical protein
VASHVTKVLDRIREKDQCGNGQKSRGVEGGNPESAVTVTAADKSPIALISSGYCNGLP